MENVTQFNVASMFTGDTVTVLSYVMRAKLLQQRYAPLIQSYTNETTIEMKKCAAVSFESENFNQKLMSVINIAKEVLIATISGEHEPHLFDDRQGGVE